MVLGQGEGPSGIFHRGRGRDGYMGTGEASDTDMACTVDIALIVALGSPGSHGGGGLILTTVITGHIHLCLILALN